MLNNFQFDDSGFSIEGPSQAKIDCKDNGDGSADITYWPTVPGEYAVHILCREEDIPKSPYMADIIPAGDYDPSKVCFPLTVILKLYIPNKFTFITTKPPTT